MKKLNFLVLLCLFMTNQVFAQRQQSFSEYWFGVKTTNGINVTPKKTIAVEKFSAKSLQENNINTKGFVNTSSIITLDLNQPQNPESFNFDENGYWIEIFNYMDYPFIEFNHDGHAMNFSHKYSVFQIAQEYADMFETQEEIDEFMDMMGLNEGFWEGFTISKSGDNSEQVSWTGNDGGCMAGGGIRTDVNGNVLKEDGVVLTDAEVPYLVGYASDMSWAGIFSSSLQTFLDDTYNAVGMYVNLSPWMYYFNISGDAGFGARPLNQEGDVVKLIITGLDENYEETGRTVEYVLAKYENGQLIQSTNWEWVDLSSLGEIAGLSYTIESPVQNAYGTLTPTYFCMDKLQVETMPQTVEYNYEIMVPEGANVYVAAPDYSGYNYKPFIEKEPVATSTIDGKTVYYYNVTGKHAYRVTQEGMLTQVGVFTPSTSATSLEITSEQLSSHSSTEIDHDVNGNNGYNVADIFLNINEKGYLNLASGDTYQLVNFRTWSMVDNTVNNYFLEPDYHYSVINENGEQDNAVVAVDENGLLTAVGSGTAIVLVTYDATNANHALGGPFFGALWPENTGVFVVSVDAPASDITSGMVINEALNPNAVSKLAAMAIDAELDVFYYLEEEDGYNYTFTPGGVTSVSLAQPIVGETMTTYNGFSAENVTNNGDGSYTVQLVQGRNIVKMTSASGTVEYQVLTAKPVSYTVSNMTTVGGKINPGDEVSVKFNTLYHPCGKMAGIYNMSAGIQYNGIEANVSLFGGPAQYTFASKAQEYRVTIPQDFVEDEFVLSNGVIKTDGFGSPYGSHRNITLEEGANSSFTALQHTAYFGALPEISIRLKEETSDVETPEADKINVYPNPFVDYIIVNAATDGKATIYNLSGEAVLNVDLVTGNNRIETFALPTGVYVLKVGNSVVKLVK